MCLNLNLNLVKYMILSVFIIGLIIGSFLNVCIYRMPKEESIVKPRSHCPECKKTIYWYDNIPVLSYLLLGGKCRFCKSKISPRYMVVEVLTAALITLSFMQWGMRPFAGDGKFLAYSILLCCLIVATFVDFKFQIIPDEISYGGMAAGVILSSVYPQLQNQAIWYMGLLNSVKGLLAGGLSIYAIGVVGKFIFKKDAMGGGDVKFLAMIGAFLGLKFAILIFFIAPFFGAVVGIIMKIKYKAEVIPYGPYLSLATIVVLFWGEKILGYLF